MRILWAIVAVLAVLFLLGIAITLPQLIAFAIFVHALGGTTLVPN